MDYAIKFAFFSLKILKKNYFIEILLKFLKFLNIIKKQIKEFQ